MRRNDERMIAPIFNQIYTEHDLPRLDRLHLILVIVINMFFFPVLMFICLLNVVI
jgi:hypothetical protein